AKCITDVINSTGQINVDFADVCTVMRNGGVAILGNAEASGENRAQRAIEEAISSPLLNDSDITGAKWILININSAAGEHEFTMDEVEVIQNYLLSQAGENTDVILGMGYDDTLGDRIGITLIATGFEHKDPFAKPTAKKEEVKTEEKIVMILGQVDEPKAPVAKEDPMVVENEMKKTEEELKPAADYLMPTLVEDPIATGFPVMQTPVIDITDIRHEEEPVIIHFELQREEKIDSTSVVNKMSTVAKNESINSTPIPVAKGKQSAPITTIKETGAAMIGSMKDSTSSTVSPVSAASGGYLARPSNIYAESKPEVYTSITSAEKPVPSALASNEEEELLALQMQIIERDDIPAADMPLAHQAQTPLFPEVEDSPMADETEEQKRRAAERLHKLRNLSFNVNAADPNNEFETVPAYIRRNMELHTGTVQVENFYSNYEVKTDEKNQSHISTINTFLDGKKPD
ncbi:MAG: cell division protein FtsZ, partial [Chitinophagaceae bacterium]